MTADELWAHEALLGADCPPLRAKLFEVACDGQLFHIQAHDRSRTELRWGPFSFFAYNLPLLEESEVLGALYPEFDSEVNSAASLRRYRDRLRSLQRAL